MVKGIQLCFQRIFSGIILFSRLSKGVSYVFIAFRNCQLLLLPDISLTCVCTSLLFLFHLASLFDSMQWLPVYGIASELPCRGPPLDIRGEGGWSFRLAIYFTREMESFVSPQARLFPPTKAVISPKNSPLYSNGDPIRIRFELGEARTCSKTFILHRVTMLISAVIHSVPGNIDLRHQFDLPLAVWTCSSSQVCQRNPAVDIPQGPLRTGAKET